MVGVRRVCMNWNNCIEDFRKDYQVLSMDELQQKYKRSRDALYSKASSLGISRREYNSRFMQQKSRKYSVDEAYFDQIETEEQAYFLGLLFADGYNYRSKRTITLDLHEKDKDILIKFNKALKNQHPLNRVQSKKYWKNSAGSVNYRLIVTNEHLSSRLQEIGCKQNKTYMLDFPKIKTKLYRHFIRGYFDGDGSVFVTKDKYNRIGLGFIGPANFMNILYDLLKKRRSKGIYLARNKRVTKPVYQIQVWGKSSTMAVLNWMYKNATIFGNRKYICFLALQELQELKITSKELYKFYEEVKNEKCAIINN